MPVNISSFIVQEEAIKDINKDFGKSDRERLKEAITKTETNVVDFGRQPQLHNEYAKLGRVYSFSVYRKWVGNSLARFLFGIDGGKMKLFAVVPKDDDTYDSTSYYQRLKD